MSQVARTFRESGVGVLLAQVGVVTLDEYLGGGEDDGWGVRHGHARSRQGQRWITDLGDGTQEDHVPLVGVNTAVLNQIGMHPKGVELRQAVPQPEDEELAGDEEPVPHVHRKVAETQRLDFVGCVRDKTLFSDYSKNLAGPRILKKNAREAFERTSMDNPQKSRLNSKPNK